MEVMLMLDGNYGFSIVMSAYLLANEEKLNKLSASITDLAKTVAAVKV